MPRRSQAQVEIEKKKVLSLLHENPNGLSRAAISRAYELEHQKKIADRTLQRWLEELVANGSAVPEGESRGTLYKANDFEIETPEGYPALSTVASRIRSLVLRPMSSRIPVGYEPDWLFSYVPGATWYLPEKARNHLREVGATPEAGRPAGTFVRDILGRLLIDLSWASSRLEGNTYSRLDTQNLLEFGQRAEGKDAQETQMILNHKAAIELVVSDSEYVGLNRATLLQIHTVLSENLLSDPAEEGRLRERPVTITSSSYTPTAIPQVIRECFDRIVELAKVILDPFEQAFFLMVHIPYLQPFTDVNKRTSRLAANLPLVKANVCPLSFVDVPEDAYIEGTLAVYEQRRVELLRDVFLFAYERSSAQYKVVRESLGQPDPVRLKYRNELADVVAETVRAMEPPNANLVRQRGRNHGVSDEDLPGFAEAARRLLVSLHEGSAGRYGLRPSEFKEWKDSFHVERPATRSRV